MNETTFLEKRPNANGQQEAKKEGSAWKQVTLGGVSGILMGAGLLYAGQLSAHGNGRLQHLLPRHDQSVSDVSQRSPGADHDGGGRR